MHRPVLIFNRSTVDGARRLTSWYERLRGWYEDHRIWRNSITVPQFTVCCGLLVIVTGSILLWIPWAHHQPLTYWEALFTATSAVTVTGLSLIDVGSDLTALGQFILLTLILVGGLGLMAITTFLQGFVQRGADLRRRVDHGRTLDEFGVGGIGTTFNGILIAALSLIASGALLLFLLGFGDGRSLSLQRLWSCVFHAASAYNNAGFALARNSLEGIRSNGPANLVIMALVLAGGLGYRVQSEVWQQRPTWFRQPQWFRRWTSWRTVARLKRRDCRDGGRLWDFRLQLRQPAEVQPNQGHGTSRQLRKWGRRGLSLHTRLVLLVSSLLVVVGCVGLLLSEAFNNGSIFRHLSAADSVWAALFQSISARTAGFHSIPLGLETLSDSSIVLLMLLMFIGASPGGTGGGIKTITVAVLLAVTGSVTYRRENVVLMGRTIDDKLVARATALTMGSLIFICAMALLLGLGTRGNITFLEKFFTCISAFATVGFDIGILDQLNRLGQLVLMLGMFVGRIGILLLFSAIWSRPQHPLVRYPSERLNL